MLNAPEGDEAALERLWNDYEFCANDKDESDVSDSESETGEITGNGGSVIGGDVAVDTDTDMPDSDIPAMDFDMRVTDVDVAMERAMALPEFVLQEDDDIVKATAFRFVYIQHALSFTQSLANFIS